MSKIKQPKDIRINGTLGVSLRWDRRFAQEQNAVLHRAQVAVDNETIKQMAPYTPMQTGVLMMSPLQGSKIGSGEIVYNTPYARYLYYGKLMVDPVTGKGAFYNPHTNRFWSRPGATKVLTDKDLTYSKAAHPLAGPFWFERMKADKLHLIRKAAERAMKK